jgi:hypothetical protein
MKFLKLLVMKINLDWSKRFTIIFLINYWNDKTSRSGPGSNLDNTNKLVEIINKIVHTKKIRTILDLPCGDFKSLKNFTEEHPNIKYIGGDIVRPLIYKNRKQFRKNNITFLYCDARKTKLPKTDLWLCRDLFIHLSFSEIYSVLKNFQASSTRYLLVSSYLTQNNHINIDIKRNIDSRILDLSKYPFNINVDRKNIFHENEKSEQWRKVLLLISKSDLKNLNN